MYITVMAYIQAKHVAELLYNIELCLTETRLFLVLLFIPQLQ